MSTDDNALDDRPTVDEIKNRLILPETPWKSRRGGKGGGKRVKKGTNETARQIATHLLEAYGSAIGRDVSQMLKHLGHTSADSVASAVLLTFQRCNPARLQRCEAVIDEKPYVGIRWRDGANKDITKLKFRWSSIRK